eukprot:14482-Heterococcus_DN1.PRE.2
MQLWNGIVQHVVLLQQRSKYRAAVHSSCSAVAVALVSSQSAAAAAASASAVSIATKLSAAAVLAEEAMLIALSSLPVSARSATSSGSSVLPSTLCCRTMSTAEACSSMLLRVSDRPSSNCSVA